MGHFNSSKPAAALVYALALASALTFQTWTTRVTPEAIISGTDKAHITRVNLPSELQKNENAEDVVPPSEELHTNGSGINTDTPSVDREAVPNNRSPVLADRKTANTRPADSNVPPVESDKPVEIPPVEEPKVDPAPKPETKPAPPANSYDSDLNNYVLDVIPTYKIGNYPYLLNTDYQNYNGVTENIYFGGRLIAKAHPSGNRASHCSGITFEVFFKAMQIRNAKLGLALDNFNGMTFSQLQDFQQLWYAAGDKRYYNLAAAIEKYGLGKRIYNLEEAKSGDFLDFSRTNNTGHSVVFLNWVRNNSGQIIGLHYWSSQGSTNGINYVTEYFDISGKGSVISNQLYIGRVLPVKSYR